ncbi:hypothetical protein JTB14_018467 [Gonioctena quinquepunctata]|nr:hypothetical protein JTB14_018467 [Gonioctena quinquepunctata]
MPSITNSDLKRSCKTNNSLSIDKDIEKSLSGYRILSMMYIKVKVLKKPVRTVKLLELLGDGGKGGTGEPGGEAGSKVDRPEGYKPPVQETV